MSDEEFNITQRNARDASELFEWFGGSRQRITLFDDLHDGAEMDDLERKYKEGFLYKQRNNLEPLGLITKTDDGVRLTDLGEKIHEPFYKLAEYSKFASSAGLLLQAIDDWEERLPDIDALKTSEIIKENDLEPTKGVDRYREELASTDSLREISCEVMDGQGFQGIIEESGFTAECIYTQEITEYIRSDSNRAEIAKQHREEGSVKHYSLDGGIEFNLSIMDQTVIIWTTRPSAPGHRILLLNGSDEVREWAEEFYKSKKKGAEQVRF
jgi:predicted transcriptional regulator